MTIRSLPLALSAALVLAAPAQAGRRPEKGFEATLPSPPAMAPTEGAIFIAAAGYAPLVSGARAQRVGDVLTVILTESTSTAKTSSNKTQRSGSANIAAPTIGPLSMTSTPLNASSSGSFNGQGNATQTNSFNGMISVTIAQVRPNGTALVRGEKRMLLAQGKEWIQFSGIVRLADVDAANQVQSGQVADARIEYAGNGSVAQSAREGWLSKFFSYISPF
jgi:flagellar L-ring protein precursor FlgH